MTSLADSLHALTRLKPIRLEEAGLHFFHGDFWRATGPSTFLELARENGLDLCLLQENEDEDDPDASAEFAYFATHIFTPIEWGWRVGPSYLSTVTKPEDIVFPEVDIVGECESAVLFLASRPKLEDALRTLASDSELRAAGLSAVAEVAVAAVGSSTHSGDFLWIARPRAQVSS